MEKHLVGFSMIANRLQARTSLSKAKFIFKNKHVSAVKRELKVYNSNRNLPFYPTHIYFVIKLDRLLTFHHQVVALRKKLFFRVTLLKHLTVSAGDAVSKQCAQLPYLLSIQQLSTAHQSGVKALTLAS